MEITDLNMSITVITLSLFMIYLINKYFRKRILRPAFSIIDDIYKDFYDTYFKDVTRSRHYLFRGEIFSTMSTEFNKAGISDDDVKNYIIFLDEGSKNYWFLSIISVLPSFLGISNIEALLKHFKNNSLDQNIKFLLLAIGTVLFLFLITIYLKIIFRNNYYRVIRDSWKKNILQDYIDFNKTDVKFDFYQLQRSRKIIDFLSNYTLTSNNQKIKFKEDKSFKVIVDNVEVQYNEPFYYKEKHLSIKYQEETYLIQVKLMDDFSNIEIIPDETDSRMLENTEFKILCEVRNNRVKIMVQRDYNLPFLGWYYTKLDTYEREQKRTKKLLINLLLAGVFTIVYLLVAFMVYYGGIIVSLFLVVYIFTDILITKMFKN